MTFFHASTLAAGHRPLVSRHHCHAWGWLSGLAWACWLGRLADCDQFLDGCGPDKPGSGLAAGAGAGAAVGLMLAFRRQHHQEIATVLTDRDATERRITELYTKAVEQLGSDKAPVRLGGLYALERLAQDNPEHRQTIINVICAYLRMPFSPTGPTSKEEPETTEDLGEPAGETEARTGEVGDTWHQERQVRLTAQRILGEHLRDDRAEDKRSTDPPSPRFWPDIRIDLAGATLVNFNLDNGVMAYANFSGATFSGGAAFIEATFTGDAEFSRATFSGGAAFIEAIFTGIAEFDEATFSGGVGVSRATFSEATFSRAAVFMGATFSGDAAFEGATFSGAALFDSATFRGAALFGSATFSGGDDGLSFERSRVLSLDPRHAWPTRWRLGPDGSGGHTVVRVGAEGNLTGYYRGGGGPVTSRFAPGRHGQKLSHVARSALPAQRRCPPAGAGRSRPPAPSHPGLAHPWAIWRG